MNKMSVLKLTKGFIHQNLLQRKNENIEKSDKGCTLLNLHKSSPLNPHISSPPINIDQYSMNLPKV